MAVTPTDPGASNLIDQARAAAGEARTQGTPGYNPLAKPAQPALGAGLPSITGAPPLPAASKGTPMPQPSPAAPGMPNIKALPTAPQIDPSAITPVSDSDAQDTPEFKQAPVIDPKAIKPVDTQTHSSVTDFARDLTQGTGVALEDVVPHFGMSMAHYLTTTVGAGLAAVADHAFNTAAMAAGDKDTAPSRLADKVFDFDKHYVQPILKYWTPKTQDAVGQNSAPDAPLPKDANAVEQMYQRDPNEAQLSPVTGAIEGGVVGLAKAYAMGPAAATQFATDAYMSSAQNAVDQGHSLATASTEGAIDAVASLVMMNAGFAHNAISIKPIVQRVVTGIGVGDFANVVANVTKKIVLTASGHPDEAAKIDPFEGLGSDTIQNAVFNAMSHETFGKAKDKGPAIDPNAVKPVAEPSAADTPAPESAPASAPASAPESAPASASGMPFGHESNPVKMPDTPSAEPIKDLKAQFADMNDKSTPRNGVFLSTDNLANLKGGKSADQIKVQNIVSQASKQARTIDLDNGTLVVKTAKIAADAKAKLDAGTDPQAVIGELTGAGSGKTPDMTHVVQGQTPDGSVASESMVTKEQIPEAVAKVQAEGKEPVITTPEAAVQRRADEIQSEAATPADASPLTVEPSPEGSSAASEGPPTLGIFKSESGKEVPVRIEEGAPAGKVRVRPLDKEGEPAKNTIDVPEAQVKSRGAKVSEPTASEGTQEVAGSGIPSEPSPADAPTGSVESGDKVAAPDLKSGSDSVPTAVESKPTFSEKLAAKRASKAAAESQPPTDKGTELPAPAAASPKVTLKAKRPQSALEALPAALAAHEAQEVPEDGKKFPGSLSERALNASAFAKVLKAAAEGATGKASPTDIERATKSANAAIRFEEKSHEDVKTGKGISHAKIAERVADMHDAARALLGQEGKPREEASAPKAAAVKATVKAKRETTKPAEEGEVTILPVNEKYKDQVVQKEKLPTREVAAQAAKLRSEYVNGDHEDLPRIAAKAEQWAHEQGYPKDNIDAMLQFFKEERATHNPNADSDHMSGTVDDNESVYEHDDQGAQTTRHLDQGEAGSKLSDIKDKLLGKKMTGDFGNLARDLKTEGFFAKHAAGSEPIGTHDFLNHILPYLDRSPMLREVVMGLRKYAPDLPIHMVNEVHQDGPGQGKSYGPNVTGQFHSGADNIQIRTPGRALDGLLQTMLHEITHSATGYELRRNPKGELALKLEQARQALVKRLSNKYGPQRIAAHLKYWAEGPNAVKPEGFMQHLYGMSDIHELLSDVSMRGPLLDEIVDSENYKGVKENLPEGYGNKTSLLGRIYAAIARHMGVDPKLLSHIVGLRDEVMQAQRDNPDLTRKYSRSSNMFYEHWKEEVQALHLDPMESAVARHSFEILDTDPPPVRGMDDKLQEAMGKEPTQIARAFNYVVKGKVVDGLRRTVMALKTVPQIFKTERDAFGHPDDPTNPLTRLEEAQARQHVVAEKFHQITRPIAERWTRVSAEDNTALGAMLRDSTLYKIDPRKSAAEQTAEARDDKKFQPKHDELAARWNKMSEPLKQLYGDVIDSNAKINRELRKAAVDATIGAYTAGGEISPAQRSLLYAARGPHEFDSLVGGTADHPINLGDRNDKFVGTLKDIAGTMETNGPYAHLGRHGDYVVSADPEGSRTFKSEGEARAFAKTVDDLSPDSVGKYVFRGGEHTVDYKAKYVSFHETRAQAEEEQRALTATGLNVSKVTQKAFGKDNVPLSVGTRDLLSEATRKINKQGSDAGSEAAVEALKSAFVTMTAQRSAYAGSKLARRNVGGVKADEMRRAYAEHAQSVMWHASQLRTVFEQADAMAKLREAARDDSASQKDLYRRGAVVDMLGRHAKDEVANYGHKSPFNSMLAKLGFASYLASPSHAAIWMTQNFTTGIPVAGARWGYGRSLAAHAKAMSVVGSPAFRGMMKATFAKGGNSSDIQAAIIKAVRADKTMGKWAQGENSPLQQLIDRGVISHGYSSELADMAQGGTNQLSNRAMAWARILPNMADAFNRVSSALAGLEMTGGDIRKTSEFVQEIHADYSQAAKPLAFKKLGRLPGASSITMFKTYAQSMIHLAYSNLYNSISGGGPGRAVAAKTLAGLVAANTLAAGVYGGGMLEVAKLAAYAWHKVMDDDNQTYDLQNSVHQFLVQHAGQGIGNVMAGGLPRAMGVDVSSRMGLGDMFFHNPPDLLSADKDAWKSFVYEEGGPMVQFLGDRVTGFAQHYQKGELFQAASSLVPLKAYQDGVKAVQLMTTGKQNSLGGQMTAPSTRDAVVQAMGFKPASVADAQEKAGTIVNFKNQVKTMRDSVLKDVVSSNYSPRAIARLVAFNNAHPVERIKSADVRGLAKAKVMSGAGMQQKDPELNAKLNY